MWLNNKNHEYEKHNQLHCEYEKHNQLHCECETLNTECIIKR